MADTPIKARPYWLPDTKGFLALGIIFLFAGTIVMMMSGVAPKDEKVMSALLVLLGVLGNEVKEVYGYFFGSSASSSAKDDTISKMIPTTPPAPEVKP